MISVSGLTKDFGDRTLFANASFQLNAGERYGLVGANGSGKTTLLNILSGHAEASSGSVSLPKRLRLGVLRQDQFLYEEQDILSVALMGNLELWEAMVARDALELGPEDLGDAEVVLDQRCVHRRPVLAEDDDVELVLREKQRGAEAAGSITDHHHIRHYHLLEARACHASPARPRSRCAAADHPATHASHRARS
jgi:ATPase subunit of ABC transporter with duplicated ATPase domains